MPLTNTRSSNVFGTSRSTIATPQNKERTNHLTRTNSVRAVSNTPAQPFFTHVNDPSKNKSRSLNDLHVQHLDQQTANNYQDPPRATSPKPHHRPATSHSSPYKTIKRDQEAAIANSTRLNQQKQSDSHNDNAATISKGTLAAGVLENFTNEFDSIHSRVGEITNTVNNRTAAKEDQIQLLLDEIIKHQATLKKLRPKVCSIKGGNKNRKITLEKKINDTANLLPKLQNTLQSRLKNVQQQERDQLKPGLMDEILANAKANRSQEAHHLIRLTQQTIIGEESIKISPENVISIQPIGSLVQKIAAEKNTRQGYKEILSPTVFLESGNAKAGFHHILVRHGTEFEKAGITANQVPELIMTALHYGKIVGFQGPDAGRPIFEVSFNKKLLKLSILIAQNGFIVAANPISESSTNLPRTSVTSKT